MTDNIAVISFPFTKSRALTDWYANENGKIAAYGILHQPDYLSISDYTYSVSAMRSVVFAKTHVLHGHWHTLNALDTDVLDFIKVNYKIVSAHKESSLVYASLDEVATTYPVHGKSNKADLIADLIVRTNTEKAKWDIWKHHHTTRDMTAIDAPGVGSSLI